MIKRRIIATKINITKQGEIKFFQVKIPFDAKVIIGIETAMRIRNFINLPTPNLAVGLDFSPPLPSPSPPPFSPPPNGFERKSLVGELRLQSCDDSNVFYATNVSDPVVKENMDKAPTVNFITENVWTHGCKRELEEVLVDGNTTILAGIYKDKLGEMLGMAVPYDVFVYVWYKYVRQGVRTPYSIGETKEK